jgi:two-component system chemotaxis response regulator CheY
MRVLLIDDEEMVRKVVRKMLERGRHDVTEAENGRIGLELLKAGTFDLAITDIVMPEVKGLDMLMTVRQLYPRMKVIVMSGGDRTGTTDVLGAAEKLGASAVMHKPIMLKDLAAALNRTFGM